MSLIYVKLVLMFLSKIFYLCHIDRENMIERGNFINDEELIF